MIPKKNITAIILTGGKSSRMGSDKGLLLLNDKTFVGRIIDAVKPLVKKVVLVGSNPKYDEFGLKRYRDVIPNCGPLGGIFTGLFYTETEDNLILSCDVPLITSEVLQHLLESSDSEADVNQLESKGETMPLVALYKKDCMHACLDELKKGERRMRTVVEKWKIKTIKLDPSMEPFVRNINTPAELEAIRNEVEH